MAYNRKAHSVFLLTYHIVLVTKYRRPVISNEMGDFMKNHAAYITSRFEGEMLNSVTDRDHKHLLVSLPPDVAPSSYIRTLKTQLSKEVHLNYGNEVKKYLFDGVPFWSPSYFIATTGTTSTENIKAYIQSQRTEEHHRKYVRTGKYAKKNKKM